MHTHILTIADRVGSGDKFHSYECCTQWLRPAGPVNLANPIDLLTDYK